jgi:type II secretory pathway pseudopilin PulG
MKTIRRIHTPLSSLPVRARFRKSGRRPGGREGGFSLIEAVVALAVFSVLGAALASIAVVSFQALESAHAEMEAVSEISLAEKLIRDSVSEIRFPIWLSALPEIAEGEEMAIPYLHGDKDLFFKMSFEGGRLIIDSPAEGESAVPSRRRFSAFAKMSWEILSTDKDEAYGVAVTLQPVDPAAPPIKVAARFGSAPLGKVDE